MATHFYFTGLGKLTAIARTPELDLGVGSDGRDERREAKNVRADGTERWRSVYNALCRVAIGYHRAAAAAAAAAAVEGVNAS